MAKAHTLVDNFNDNAVTVNWTVVDAFETNRRVEIRPRPSLPGVNFSYYQSDDTFDMRDSEARVEVVQALSQGPGTATFLSAVADGTTEVFLTIEDGKLQAGSETVSGGLLIYAEVPYQPERHRWLRLRDQAGTLNWEFSAEGKDFEVLYRSGWPFDPATPLLLVFGAGTQQEVQAPGFAAFDNFNFAERSRERRIDERRFAARQLREELAQDAFRRDHDPHHNNNDEAAVVATPLAGNHSKSLVHDALGDPDPHSYATLLRALQSRDSADFEEIVLADEAVIRLTNPQAGLAFELGGADTQELTQPPAPGFLSQITRDEMGELYWMAVNRDLPFREWADEAGMPGSGLADAIESLNTEFPRFGGTLPATVDNVFRGVYLGEQAGPYVSQFLLKGNVDPRKAAGSGRDAADGFINYGTQVIDQRHLVAAVETDYLTVFADWLDVQNGADTRGADVFDATRRFIHTLRDGATFVHFDLVLNAFFNAGIYLLAEPTGNQSTFQSGVTGRPYVDMEFPFNPGSPYLPGPGGSLTQKGFGTFGPIHLLQTLGEVLGRAIRAVWWQKWGVHRRLRPEEYGGRVDNQIRDARVYFSDEGLINSLTQPGGMLRPYFGSPGEPFGDSYLLPQAYPEGSPTHPAYGAGHATGSGACATLLKAFFDEVTSIQNPVQANADGTALEAYTGGGAGDLTVGGELNKLAGNISIFRNAAGVHWRSDYTDSLPLGEAVAIRYLQEVSLGFNEKDAYFQLTTFDGRRIRIHGGVAEQLFI
jgi:hypothetical protein